MISIVVPVYNEEASLVLFNSALSKVIKQLSNENFEVIYINDGSTDTSGQLLDQFSDENAHIHHLRFYKNYGQTAALDAGFKASQGDIVVALDSDMQNDPHDIPKLLAKLSEGYDVVSGWRKKRNDPMFSKKIPSFMANALIRRITKVPIHDFGCTLKVYRREFLKHVNLFGEMHRFIPVYAQWNGAKITEIETNHHARQYGISNYGIGRTWRVLLDLLTIHFLGNYSTSPIYFFGKASFWCFLGATGTFSVVFYRKLILGASWISPMIFIGFFLFGLAIQCLFFGVLAEMVSRIYFRDKDKLPYHIKSFSRNNSK